MIVRVLPIAVVAALALLGGCGEPAAPKKKPPLSVAVEAAATADYTPRLTVLGTVTPLASVAVRTRVDGQIDRVLFGEGDTVRAGQPLFRLDDRAVRATIAQNRAVLASANATATQAAADLRRSRALVANGFVSKATIDLKQAAADSAVAGIGGARAAISAAETALSYLTVTAPVSGRTGEINFKTGATVRASDTLPLVTVNQLSPILVRFAVPPEQIQSLRSALAAGPVAVVARIHVDGDAGPALAPIATGRLVFLDNAVDPATGSLPAKAEFDNARSELWPGALVDLDVPLGAARRLVSLPEAAIQNGPDFIYAWTLDAAQKVTLTKVTLAGRAGGRAYLASGVAPGTPVVVDALAKLRAGDAVRVKGRGNGGGGADGKAAR